MIKLSAHIGFLFNEMPFLDRFAAASAAGFKSVEFVSPYEYDSQLLGDLLAQHNVDLVQFASPPGVNRGMAALVSGVAMFRESLKITVRYAKTLNCSRVHLMAGARQAGGPAMDSKTYLENISYAVDFLSDFGIQSLIEVISPTEVPGYLMRSFELAEALFDAVRNPNLRLILDTYHAQLLTGDIPAVLNHWWDRTGHIQISDCPGRHEPGTGEIDFNRFFSMLEQREYEGWVGCEYRPLESTQASLNSLRPFLIKDK